MHPAPSSRIHRSPAASLLLCAWLAILCSCANDPKEMPAYYVSPYAYKDLDCDELAHEMNFVAARTSELYDQLLKRYQRDRWQAAFVWFYGITAFYLDGDGPEAQEYRQLKGEFAALRTEAYRKDCGLDMPSPEEIMREAETQRPASP